MSKKLHVIIHGKVQGVNFRWATYEKAQQLNLVGWIKNTAARKVEAVCEGNENDLKAILEFVKEGPVAASVRTVEEDWSEASKLFSDFRIEY